MVSLDTILQAVTCEEIFINDKKATKSLYRELAKKYHPDVYKGANAEENFRHINELYEEAMAKIDKGIWNEKDVLSLESELGKKYKLKYLKDKSFVLGKVYIGRTHVIYLLDSKNQKYYDNALTQLRHLRYANSSMEKEFKRYFPNIVTNFRTKTGEYCIVLKKDVTDYPLEEFLEYYKKQGKVVDSKHTAWIMSRFLNIACFFKYNNIVHNGLSLSNCFISPKYHTIMVFGGWWYVVPVGEKMIGTQKSIFDLMPVKEKAEKIATYKTDLESIRSIGRTLNFTDLPDPLRKWLNQASSENAIEEFDNWNKVLLDSFGERKFIELNISEKDIFG